MIFYEDGNNAGPVEKLELLTCIRMRPEDGVEKKTHVCENYEFLYLSNGGGSVAVNGRTFSLREDQFFLVPRGAEAGWQVSGSLCYYLELSAEGVSGLEKLPDTGLLGRNIHIGDLCYHLFRLCAKEPALDFSKDAILALILEQALSSDFGDQPGRELYEKFREYVEENLEGNLSAEAVSRALRYNKDYISRVVKRFSGKNMKEYIVTERIYTARTLLANGNLPLSAIAKATGYDSVELFTKFFRYYTKYSPLEYRRQFRKE